MDEGTTTELSENQEGLGYSSWVETALVMNKSNKIEELPLDGNQSAPSLTLFAGEVASQQLSQKVEMESLQDVLHRLRDDVVKKRKNYQNLSAERLLWERKIGVHKEDSVHSKTEIDILKSELLKLIDAKQKNEILTCSIASDLDDIVQQHNAGLETMRAQKKRVLQLEADNDLNQRLSQKLEQLQNIRQKIAEYDTTTDTTLNSCSNVSRVCASLVREKEKLTGILISKRKCIETEDIAMSKKRIDEDATKKRLVAQKLRLTKQIEREERITEGLKKSYDSIRLEIGNVN